MILEKLEYKVELPSENTSVQFPVGKNMPLSVYTFSVDNQEHIFQTFDNNVIVASVKNNGKTVYLSNKFLEKIGENAIRISL